MKRPLIALIGSSGQVGSAILQKAGYVQRIKTRLDHTRANLRDELQSISPDIIINAGAYTDVDLAETNQPTCFDVNTSGVSLLIEYCMVNDCRLIHFSSDYVFNGQKSDSYKESDSPRPANIYGWSKYFADQLILGSKIRANILRPSWVMGPRHTNFVHKILSLGMMKDSLHIISDQIGRPTSSNLLADSALWLATNDIRESLIHVSDDGVPSSWYAIATHAFAYAQDLGYRGLTAENVYPIASKDYKTPAIRPKNSLLDCSLFEETIAIERGNWTQTVEDIVREASHGW